MSCMSTTLANPCSCFRQRAPWWDCDLSAVRWVSEEIVRPSPRLLSLALALWRARRELVCHEGAPLRWASKGTANKTSFSLGRLLLEDSQKRKGSKL